MEAAVLNPAMVADVDHNSNSLNAELEVKKLQELVRKLERQNEQLRTRATGTYGGGGGFCLSGPLPALLRQASLGSFVPPEEHFDYFLPHTGGDGAAGEDEDEEDEDEEEDGSEPSVLDELELLDLNSLSCSDESDETWLYVSPKARDSSDDSLTPMQWCRQGLDSPKSEVEAARRSLSLRLEQGRSLRRSALSPQSSMDSDLGASEAEDDSIALGYKLHDLTDVQVMARLQEENLRAHRYFSFINPRRSKTGLRQHVVGPGQPPQPELHLPAQPAQRRPRPGGGRRGGRRRLRPPAPAAAAPHPPSALPHLLQHPRLAKKHKLPVHPSFHTLNAAVPFRWVRLPASAPGIGTGPGPGQPQRSRAPGLQTRISWPYCFGETSSCHPADFENKLRRSMPNLVRAPSMPSVPIPTNPSASPCLLRNSQSFDSSTRLTRLQSSIPSPGQLQNRVQSVGNFTSLSRQTLKATAYVSPTIKGSASMPTSTSLQSLSGGTAGGNSGVGSGIPMLSKPPGGGGTPTSTPATPRSGLPRPASFVGTPISTPRSKVAQPTRSLLTPPKSLSTLSALRDSTWRDGCY
ncbi:SLAIN motif-containing protein 1-like isoform X4 [Sparus aurata]|uniref:SLAIN motif-containing protein 1-like isoform X4 n=1 Tax=Sparus aurata TaxID=8175 RepID=UPI0011C1D0E4|nr:SLAIN motif-containing protein 1-like isoform X4 [Sparus aurata]